jgi:hypothetical protein
MKEKKISLKSNLRKLDSIGGVYSTRDKSGLSINKKSTHEEEKVNENNINAIDTKEKIELNKEIIKEENTTSYFKLFPSRKEPSGNTRHFIGDVGFNESYFEIYLWESEYSIFKFDLYYDIQHEERVISWNKNSKRIIHSMVVPEKEKTLGMKKIQTLSDEADYNLDAILDKYDKRLNATISKIEDNVIDYNFFLIDLLKFVKDILINI